MDRGIATKENVRILKDRGYHYIVTLSGQSRRSWLQEIRRGAFLPLDANHPEIEVWESEREVEVYLLVQSASRIAKDIRERFSVRLEEALQKLSKQLASRKLPREKALLRIGRLRQRYPRASRIFLSEIHEPGARPAHVRLEAR